MTDQQHRFVPPHELLREWENEYASIPYDLNYSLFLATKAAQWGADQELDACCTLADNLYIEDCEHLRSARRPKSQILKEQTFDLLRQKMDEDEIDIIRRALESLPE